MTLPLKVAVCPSNPQDDRSPVGLERLLVLDDDFAIGHTIGFIAKEQGFACKTATTPREFFEELDRWQPTHIALDLVLPEMDGIEVLRKLGERQCKAGIIIMSGTGSRVVGAAQRSALEHGLNIIGVLDKPFLPSKLRLCLNQRQDNKAAFGAAKISHLPVSESEIRRAIANKQFTLFLQPKILSKSGELAGYEALIRWQCPNGELILPDRFIPFAEKCGLIDDLTQIVVEQALQWLASMLSSTKVPVSLNLSPASLTDIHLADWIAERCAKLGVHPDKLIFELTETSTMRDPVTALDLLTRLRLKGFRLSIDDFGTGYSSALQLVRLPFSEMKIDKSFVGSASTSAESRTVIKSIVDLGHNLGLWLTAEGVEDLATLNFLREIGCDMAQGFYIGRPMPAEMAKSWKSPSALEC